VLGARICLRLDNVEWSIHGEVECQVRLRVVREGQLLGHQGCVVTRDRPLLNLNLLAALQPV
jgi:hypothetical protein